MKIPLSELRKGDFVNMFMHKTDSLTAGTSEVVGRVPYQVESVKKEKTGVFITLVDKQGQKKTFGFLDPSKEIEKADGFSEGMTEIERLQKVIDNQKAQLELMQKSGTHFLKAKWKLDAIEELCDIELSGFIEVFKIRKILEGE